MKLVTKSRNYGCLGHCFWIFEELQKGSMVKHAILHAVVLQDVKGIFERNEYIKSLPANFTSTT